METVSFTIGRFARVPTLVLLLTLSLAACLSAKTEKEEHTVGGCRVYNLRVDSKNAAEAAIRIDYDYEGRGRPPLRVVASVEKKGQELDESTFWIEQADVLPGTGSASINVRYLEQQQPLTTDQIKLRFIYPISKYEVGAVTFDRSVSWGRKETAVASTVPVTLVKAPDTKAPESKAPDTIAPESKVTETKVPETRAPETRVEAVHGKADLAAADEASQPVAGGSFSAMSSKKRAAWQERLTLGAGDVLNFSLFGEPDLTIEEVFVGPDGRVSYLEAQGVMAAGLTIDELRVKFDEELGKYRRSPRTIITPALFQSKKYFILGRVSQKGVFTLDRPVTVIEAIARARGFETGMTDRDLRDLADLSHSFIARNGERIPVDFEKLFLEGDLSQNIPLEPNDYLYFPASDVKEVYVLGEVKYPGSVNFSSAASTVGAISQRGGFTEKAWKGKVLVVRGSLNRPETFVVNMSDVLSAKTPDFKLEARDIVYVSSRPWAKAEELLDVLATAFVQAAVITWTGGNIGSIIK